MPRLNYVHSLMRGSQWWFLWYQLPATRLLHLSPLWDKKVDVLQVTDTKETTIEIRALMSARNSGEAFDLRCYVRENLIAFIEKNYPDSLPRTRAEIKGVDCNNPLSTTL